MQKGIKNQKGITLIALVITIIVMLILVGVSVTVALNGGLFNTAKKASNETKIERDEEQMLADGVVNVAGKEYNIMEEYGDKEAEAKTITFYIGGKTPERAYTTTVGTTWTKWVEENPSRNMYIDGEGFVRTEVGGWLTPDDNLSYKVYGIDPIYDEQNYEELW